MEKLEKILIKENKEKTTKALKELNKATKENIIDLWYYREKLTKTQYSKLLNNEITLKEVKQKIKDKIIKENTKQLENKLNKLEEVKKADYTPNQIIINTTWVKNRMWGYNPNTTVTDDRGQTTTGKASGYGYDKESASVAKALNQNDNILKMLYEKKNKNAKIRTKDDANTQNRNILGYGSGYSVLPYFEGGVGMSSLTNIFKKLGYNVSFSETKTATIYIITKKGVK